MRLNGHVIRSVVGVEKDGSMDFWKKRVEMRNWIKQMIENADMMQDVKIRQ